MKRQKLIPTKDRQTSAYERRLVCYIHSNKTTFYTNKSAHFLTLHYTSTVTTVINKSYECAAIAFLHLTNSTFIKFNLIWFSQRCTAGSLYTSILATYNIIIIPRVIWTYNNIIG